jgi:hypothetical protein
MRGWTVNPPADPYQRFNWTVAKLCRVEVYLIETRDIRKKGSKLAPEQIVMDALMAISRELQ